MQSYTGCKVKVLPIANFESIVGWAENSWRLKMISPSTHTNAHHEKSPQSESSNPQIRLYLFVFQSMYLPILPFLLIYGRIDDQLLLN